MGTSFHGGLVGNPMRRLICRGFCVEEGSGTGVSPYMGLVGEAGGGPPTRNFEN